MSKARSWRQHLGNATGAIIACLLGLGLLTVSGESPSNLFDILYRSVAGSTYDFGMVLHYTLPLTLTGLAVALPLRAGLFNIGGEGQMLVGAMAAAAVGILWSDLPPVLALPLAMFAAALAGGIWALLPALLLVRRGVHEVISCIFLNFIAAGLTSYLALDVLANLQSQNPETAEIGAGYRLSPIAWFDDAPVNYFMLVIAVGVVALGLWKRRSVGSFKSLVVGLNPRAARAAGINVPKVFLTAMMWGGVAAGLAGLAEIIGNMYRFRIGFSGGFGFMGIAVALVAGSRPLYVLPSALFFAVLHKWAGDLEFETENISKDFALIVQGMILLLLTARWGRRRP